MKPGFAQYQLLVFYRLIAFTLTLFPLAVSAQPAQKADRFANIISVMPDTLVEVSSKRLDSLKQSAERTYAQLKVRYDSINNAVSSKRHRIQASIDSLENLRLPAGKLTSKLDSLEAWKNKSLKAFSSKVDSLKNKLKARIGSLELSPELAGRASEFTNQLDKLNLELPNTTLLVSVQGKLDVAIPDLPSIPGPNVISGQNPPYLPSLESMPKVELRSQVSQYQNEIANLPTDIDGAAKLAEEKASNISVMGDVQKELTQVEDVTKVAGNLKDQEQLKQQLVSEVKEQAMDHFADKQEQLTKAMETVSKLKSKFPTTTSMIDLPKKAPNAMKSKPLIERIIPGLAFQLQKKNDDLLVDINPYLAYRFTTRLSAGAGWNQRIGYNTDAYSWSSKDANIFGPRLFSEYKIGRGFSPRLEIEVMNAFVPPYIKTTPQDLGEREWVWGAFAGIKKDYKFMKRIKGTALIMFRLFDPHRKSPYADVVNARFGFEFPMKKKPANKNT